jgi:GMP synthase (glutamine-hydrolysing)
MGGILIVKVGSTFPALRAVKGDFEDWILAGMGLDADATMVVDVQNGDALPEPGALSGVVVTGSHASVTDHAGWSERMAAWLRATLEGEVPTLGICYGHQLLAYALGGDVADNPRGLEFGTVPVQLERSAREDALLGGLPNPIRAHVCHSQTVVRLPEGARRLAYSRLDPNQAFVVGDSAWGLQFHPEFDAGTVRVYIDRFSEQLAAQGQDPGWVAESCVDTPTGPQILRRFAELVEGRKALSATDRWNERTVCPSQSTG